MEIFPFARFDASCPWNNALNAQDLPDAKPNNSPRPNFQGRARQASQIFAGSLVAWGRRLSLRSPLLSRVGASAIALNAIPLGVSAEHLLGGAIGAISKDGALANWATHVLFTGAPPGFAVPAMAGSLLGLFGLDLAIQFVGFLVSVTWKTERHYDLTGSLTFGTLSLLSLASQSLPSWRQRLLSGMQVTWAARLGSFLFYRILKDRSDRRFDDAKKKPAKMFVFWLVQGLWVFMTALPVLLLNNVEDKTATNLEWSDALGVAMWLVGIALETTADIQKMRFKDNPANKGKWIDSGLWRLSRHPNYFGEMLLQAGMCVTAAAALRSRPELLAASAAGPAFVTFLLLFVSGVPLLEEAADKKWGGDAAYQAYKRRTPCIVPWLR
eukprot:jgi/Mesvir1/22708/Mv14122-RA.1